MRLHVGNDDPLDLLKPVPVLRSNRTFIGEESQDDQHRRSAEQLELQPAQLREDQADGKSGGDAEVRYDGALAPVNLGNKIPQVCGNDGEAGKSHLRERRVATVDLYR